jgi:hypothetical protein
MRADLEAVEAVLTENLGTGGLSEFDLQRIKIPAGGMTAYEVNDLEGTSFVPTIHAVILFARDVRAYWPDSLDESGGGKPPACHSNDGKIGIGAPGGICAQCPMAQFGSAKKGKGQACKQVKQLFLLREGSGSILPENFLVPPTGLNNFKKLALMLGGRGVSISGILVEIGLVKAKSAEGITYSQPTFRPVRTLAASELSRVKKFAELFRPLIDAAINIAPLAPQPQSGLLTEDAPGDPAWS